jgi:hypothetical protein
MKARYAPEDLVRHWVHSHEEDTAGRTVFRPAEFKFPRSRGRRSFELKADGSFIEWDISPADTRRPSLPGTWTIEDGRRLLLSKGPPGTPPREMTIASVDKDRLVIQK